MSDKGQYAILLPNNNDWSKEEIGGVFTPFTRSYKDINKKDESNINNNTCKVLSIDYIGCYGTVAQFDIGVVENV